MGKDFVLGQGRFSYYQNADDLKSAGYISGIRVRELITQYLLKDPKDYKSLNMYMEKINENIPRVRVGIGKSTRYYYYEKSVNGLIRQLQNGEDLSQSRREITKDLKSEGFISGNDFKKHIYATLEVWSIFDSFTNSEFISLYRYITGLLPNAFIDIFGEKSVRKLGSSKSLRYYYNLDDTLQYVKDIIPIQYDNFKKEKKL